MILKPSNGRSIITRLAQGFSIGIPSRKNWFVIIFLSFWLCGWLMGEVFAISSLQAEFGEEPFRFFVFIWLAMWTFGGAMVIYTILWQVFGREVMSVEGKVFNYQRMIFGFGRTRSFDIREMKKVCLDTESQNKKSVFYSGSPRGFEVPWGMKSGKIKFNYGLKTYYFASDVDKAEADHLLQLLKDSANFTEQNFA